MVKYGRESGKLDRRVDGRVPVYYTFDPYLSGTCSSLDRSLHTLPTTCTRYHQHGSDHWTRAIHDLLLPMRWSIICTFIPPR
jgi:hypothetical protein